METRPQYHDVGDDEMGLAPPIVADGPYFRPGMNSVNTGTLDMVRGTGGRFEFGYSEDNWGWVSSILSMNGFYEQLHAQRLRDSVRRLKDADDHVCVQYLPFFNPDNTVTLIPTASVITRDVGYLDGFVSQNVGGSPVDDNQNGNITHGRFKPTDLTTIPLEYDPTSPDSQLQPANYDLDDLVRLATTFGTLKVTLRSDIRAFELMPYSIGPTSCTRVGTSDLMMGGRILAITKS